MLALKRMARRVAHRPLPMCFSQVYDIQGRQVRKGRPLRKGEKLFKGGLLPHAYVNASSEESVAARLLMGRLKETYSTVGRLAKVTTMNLFKNALREGQATVIHCNWAMTHLCETTGRQRDLMNTMREKGITPNVYTYQPLIKHLLHAGKREEARHILDVEMPCDLGPDAANNASQNGKQKSPAPPPRREQRTLNQILMQDNNTRAAWQKFYDLLASEEITVEDCIVMLKACYDVAQMRQLIDVMTQAKLKPDVVLYRRLITAHRMEGDDAAAKKVVEEMVQAGVRPDNKTKTRLSFPRRGDALMRMRTNKLSLFLQLGGDEATAAAWSMMHTMVEHGVASTHHLTVMLKFCKDSDEMRELINVTMPKANVKPDVEPYTMLVGRLRKEGDDVAAKRVVEEEMQHAGVEPDAILKKILSLPAGDAKFSKLRTSTIQHLLKLGSGGERAAAKFCRGLHGRKLLEQRHWDMMIDHSLLLKLKALQMQFEGGL